VLTAKQVYAQMLSVDADSQPVATGACVT
jgi:hypothetical protein